MLEKKFQTEFTKWAKHNVHANTAFELKVTNGNTLPFSAIRAHQWINLQNAKHRSLVYKIPDEGMAQKPFDCFVLSGAEAYFVIMFYSIRGTKDFYIIDVDELERFFTSTKRVSINEEEAYSLATRIGKLA